MGALLKWLPAEVQSKTAGLGEALNGQKTLNSILDLLWSKIGTEAGVPARPFDVTGADAPAERACARPPRFRLVAHAEELPQPVPTALPAGTYVITDDGAGVAPALAELVKAAGGRPKLLAADQGLVDDFVRGAAAAADNVVGFVHLAPFAAQPLAPDCDPSIWRAAVRSNELLPHQFVGQVASLQANGRVLLVSGLGGAFGRDGSADRNIRVAGGGPGLAKTLREEWPDVVAKAIDLPHDRSAAELAGLVFAELALPGGRIEVGYPKARRTIFRTEAAEIDLKAAPRDALPNGAVVLATGGARGITAETLRPLARPGVTLVLVGRSALPAAEDAALAALATDGALRAHLIGKARASGETPRPRDIDRQVQAILRDREIRANIADLRAAGAEVVYRIADLRNADEATATVAEVYGRYGRIDGVIHGAGLIEDKMIVDKDAESWLRVVETKAFSAFTIARALKPEGLRFFVMFGSVAGRYGNSGQADYAAANELLNRFAWQLRALWPQSVKIAVLNWGPWLGSRYGSGMVSAETRRKFEGIGVHVVEPEGGAQLCRDEIIYGPIAEVEIVVGEGPWEGQETRRSAVRSLDLPQQTDRSPAFPLLIGADTGPGPRGGRSIVRTLSLATDPYLDQHRIDGVPVLPVAVAVEMAAEAAATVWPGWQVAEVSEIKMLQGFRLEGDRPRPLELTVLGSEHGDASGFKATVELRSPGAEGRVHYRASLLLSDRLPEEPFTGSDLSPRASLSAREAYRNLLFHGPCFQAVVSLTGLDERGAVAQVVPSDPAEFRTGVAPGSQWLFDPALIDAAAQLAWVWSCQQRGAAALPNRFGCIRRFANAGRAHRMLFEVARDCPEHQVRADVLVLDDRDRLVFTIEGLESTANASLNRFRGWAGEIRV